MNRRPRRERQIYPDPDGGGQAQGPLVLYYLQVGKGLPAEDDYKGLPNRPQVLAALEVINSLLAEKRPVPRSRMESFTYGGVKLYEIKAPQRGKMISRLLAYVETDWTMFLAFAGVKKTQDLPAAWKKTASDRVKDALKESDLPL